MTERIINQILKYYPKERILELSKIETYTGAKQILKQQTDKNCTVSFERALKYYNLSSDIFLSLSEKRKYYAELKRKYSFKELKKKVNEFPFPIDEFKALWYNPDIKIQDITEYFILRLDKRILEDILRRKAKEYNFPTKARRYKWKPTPEEIQNFPYELAKELCENYTYPKLEKYLKQIGKKPIKLSWKSMLEFYKLKPLSREEAHKKGILKASNKTDLSIDDLDLNLTLTQLARKHDVCSNVIRRILDENNKECATVYKSKDLLNEPEKIQKFIEMWNNTKVRVVELEKEFNFGECTIRKITNELGLGTKASFTGVSYEEKRILDFIKYNTDLEVINNTKDIIPPKEIDIVIPDLKLGIEYNGIMHHCIGKCVYKEIPDTSENRNYHLQKTEETESKGYQLIHIFSNEMNDPEKRKIWICSLLYKLKKAKRIPARKCTIKELSYTEVKDFIQKNHLQGASVSKINIGLFYKDKLISVMTFSKGRNSISKNYQYEMIRFCTKKGYAVQGGASKLFKYFIRKYNPDNVVSFANRRWAYSENNLYRTLGFKFSHNTRPNYFYFKTEDKLYSRNKFQKHKLKNELENFDPNKTEWENMRDNNYKKIYDAGNLVYIWESPQKEA